MSKTHIAIQDQIGRTVIGILDSETESTLTMENPVVLHLELEGNGQIQVQTFPVFFFELLDKDRRDSNKWTYHKSNIVLSEVVLSDNIIAQYSRLNNPVPQVAVPTSPKVISIDDL
jgi:anaerobic ribonucleoside-triphosphate reductase